jgi:RES domain
MQPVPLPPRNLAAISVSTVQVSTSKLHSISRFDSGEPFFGKSGSNRFDDPNRTKSKRFGTCYFGLSLEVAIAETILHDEMPIRGRFEVAAQEIENRHCVRFRGQPLTLVDLTGTALKALIGNGAISTTMPYDVPQRWASALHRHPVNADGILYMSRHVNDERAVVVFDRARAKLGVAAFTPLAETKGALRALTNLRVSVRFV